MKQLELSCSAAIASLLMTFTYFYILIQQRCACTLGNKYKWKITARHRVTKFKKFIDDHYHIAAIILCWGQRLQCRLKPLCVHIHYTPKPLTFLL